MSFVVEQPRFDRLKSSIAMTGESCDGDSTNAVVVEFQDLSQSTKALLEANKNIKREQNTLPIWHQLSTVTNQSTNQSTVSASTTTSFSSSSAPPSTKDAEKPESIAVDDEENSDIQGCTRLTRISQFHS